MSYSKNIITEKLTLVVKNIKILHGIWNYMSLKTSEKKIILNM